MRNYSMAEGCLQSSKEALDVVAQFVKLRVELFGPQESEAEIP
jgi:hypothetical protein